MVSITFIDFIKEKKIETIDESILFLINGGLGDSVMISPSIIACAKSYKKVSVYCMTERARKIYPLFGANIHKYSRPIFKESFETVYCTCDSETLKKRVKRFNIQATKLLTPKSFHGSTWEYFNREFKSLKPETACFANLLSPNKDKKIKRNLVLLGPGVGRGAEKKWNKWLELLKIVPHPYTFIGDKNAYQPWQDDYESAIGQTKEITDLIPLFDRARMYIGVDNGLGHLAASFGIPTITIFTTTDADLFTPPKGLKITNPETGGDVINLIFEEFQRPLINVEKIPKVIGMPLVSVIVTSHNEGEEVRMTFESILKTSKQLLQPILVDEASTDNSTIFKPSLASQIHTITHTERKGVAPSRHEAVVKVSNGKYVMFLDAHQRLSNLAIDILLESCQKTGGLITPGLGALYSQRKYFNFGGKFELKEGRLHSTWVRHHPKESLVPCESFVAPGWMLSKENFEKIDGWCSQQKGWGSTEVAIALKCLFAGIPVLACRDAVAWHRFRDRAHYKLSYKEVWRNAYVIAKVCFDSKTFENYWKPLYSQAYWQKEFNKVLENCQPEHEAFQKIKVRPDSEVLARILGAPCDIEGIIKDRRKELKKYDSKIGVCQVESELVTVAKKIHKINPERILEIGVRRCGWLYPILGVTFNATKYLGVDNDKKLEPLRTKILTDLRQTHRFVEVLDADSQNPLTVDKVKEYFENAPIDVLHIDGGHNYEEVMRDWKNYSPLVKKGGLILIHDIYNPDGDVGRFWSDVKLGRKNWEETSKSRYGVGILYKEKK